MVGRHARAALLLVALFAFGSARGQGALELLKPAWLTAAGGLRAAMREQAFAARARSNGAMAVDDIFEMAMRASDGDIGTALLAATTACFDHRMIHVKLGPLRIPVPLNLESDSLAACTHASLPSQLFDDSPPDGDRDKLQHFFGSAYIAWSTRIPAVADAAGVMIELVEPALIDGGANDPRDLRANRAGRAFAGGFDDESYIVPSWFFHTTK
jgi:hypothetical protein